MALVNFQTHFSRMCDDKLILQKLTKKEKVFDFCIKIVPVKRVEQLL